MRLIKAIFVLALIAAVALCASAPAENTLQLPAGLSVVGERAFYGSASLESVTVPEGAQEIRAGAFAYSSLSEISLPSSLTYIADDAFEYVTGLTIYGYSGSCAETYATEHNITFVAIDESGEDTSDYTFDIIDDTTCRITGYTGSETGLTLPSEWTDDGGVTRTVTAIGQYAFGYNRAITSVIIPASVTSLDDYAFAWCSGLTNVVIPEGVVRIGIGVFQYCDSLTEIAVPASVTFINYHAFASRGALTQITVDTDNPNYVSIDGVLYDKDVTTLHTWPAGKSDFSLPESVTAIGTGAFYTNESLTSIMLPDSITTIGGTAFMGCTGLSHIDIPYGVISIGSNAFGFCYNLRSIDIPASVTSLDNDLFMDCKNLTEINISNDNEFFSTYDGVVYNKNKTVLVCCPPGRDYADVLGSVTRIENNAFYGCDKLNYIWLPDSVTYIGFSAFLQCTGLTEINLPSNVTYIGMYAFAHCSGLTRVVMKENVTAIAQYAFYNCANLASITIPDSVTQIGMNAFTGCKDGFVICCHEGSYAETYAIQNNISCFIIGDYVFDINSEDECSISGYTGSETELILPSSWTDEFGVTRNVVGLESNALSNNPNLISVTIPESITYIGMYVFGYDDSLTEIIVAEGNPCYSSEDGVVYNKNKTSLIRCASGKTSVSIPESVTEIGDFAFTGCRNLTEITIPESVITIYGGAFLDCSSLTSIHLSSGITYFERDGINGCSSLSSITVSAGSEYYASEDGVLYNNDKTRLICCPAGKTSVSVPVSVNTIAYAAFADCVNLTEISLPASVTTIEGEAFRGCSGLVSFVIPNGVQLIEYNTFCNCSSLTSLTIPASVTFIDADTALYGNSENLVIYCVEGSYAETYAIENNINYAYISEEVPDTSDYTFEVIDENTCEITGYTGSDTVLVLPQLSPDGLTVTAIGDRAFASSGSLTSVTIPDGVTSIGTEAFYYCTGLTSITIPDSVTSLGMGAVCFCSGLTEITIPYGVTSVTDWAFTGCSGLTDLTIPNSVTEIREGAFSNCSSLTSITIPNGVLSIGKHAFESCTNLTQIILPASVTFIEGNAFNNTDNVTITAPAGSYAETYANDNNIPFEALSDAVTVTIWHTLSSGQSAYLQSCADSFNSAHDGYQVELVSKNNGSFTSELEEAVLDGTGPDIILNYASAATEYVESGRAANLDAYIYSGSAGIAGFDESLPEGILEGEINGFSDGHIHFLPAYTTGPVLYYNKTLFDELALSVPTSWTELEAACREIRQQKGIPGVGLDSLTDCIQALIMESGSGYIDVQNNCVAFDTNAAKEQLEWLIDCVNEGLFLTEATMDYFSNDFTEGACAAYIGSSAGYAYIMPEDFEFAIAPMPCDNWYPTWNRGPIVFDYDDSARVQGAYEFVKYFISPEVNFGWVQAVQGLSPYAGTRALPAYSTYLSGETIAAQSLRAVNANMDKAGALPNVKGAAAVRSNLSSFVKNVVKGANFEEAWNACISACNAALQ